MKRSTVSIIYLYTLLLASAWFLKSTSTGTAANSSTEWVAKYPFNGQQHTVTIKPQGDGKTALVSIVDAGNSEIAKVTIQAKKGLESTITAACKANDLIGQGKMAAGCLSTAAAGACLYTGLGGGVGAGFCVATIDYAANKGAIDCVKGLSEQISKMLEEKEAFEFFQNANFAPEDLVDRAIGKACEEWNTRQNK